MNIKWWHIALFVIVMLTVAVALHPTRLRVGWMLAKSGLVHQAIEKLEDIYEKDPNNYRAIRIMALALEGLGRTDEAKVFYERLLSIKPNEDNYRDAVRFYLWTRQPEEAQRTYENWLQFRRSKGKTFVDEDGQQILDDLYALYLTGQNYRKAIEILNLRKDLFPKETRDIENDLITLHQRTGDLPATISFLEDILKKGGRNPYAVDTYVELAPLAGKKAAAEYYLAENIKEHPDDERVWKKMIDFETNQKDYASADKWFSKWMEKNPENLNLKQSYADWLIATEQQKRAIAYIEGLPPEYRDNRRFQDTLLKLYEWNNVKEKLVGPYTARFNENPSDGENAKKLFWLLMDLKRYNDAEKVASRLNSMNPDRREYIDMLLSVYEQRNESKKSLSLLEKAAERTDDPKLLKRLGERYLWNAEEGR